MRRFLIIAVVLSLAASGCRGGKPPRTTTTTRTTAPVTTVQVFFTPTGAVQTDCGETTAVARDVAGDPLTGALTALLEGPTATERQTVTSWFSDETAGTLNDVTIANRVARVDLDDLRPIIPNASASCGSAILLGELDATVTQFPDVDRAVYSFNGDIEAFYGWLQLSPPAA
jgi:spore germination protein GerM